jgi:hypothetical protein
VGYLHQNARAVAGVRLGTARAAVLEVAQNLKCLLDDGMRIFALDIDHKTHTARLMLESRIIKPLLGRRHYPPRHVFGPLCCVIGHFPAIVPVGSFIFYLNHAPAQ